MSNTVDAGGITFITCLSEDVEIVNSWHVNWRQGFRFKHETLISNDSSIMPRPGAELLLVISLKTSTSGGRGSKADSHIRILYATLEDEGFMTPHIIKGRRFLSEYDTGQLLHVRPSDMLGVDAYNKIIKDAAPRIRKFFK